MACNMKKMKGYLVSVLVLYTVLVTFFLAQTAWDDEVKVTKRRGHDDKLLNVLYQEERRHLRSFKDVIQTYGGLVPLKVREKMKREDLVKSMDGVDVIDRRLPRGGNTPNHYSTDFYVEETNVFNLDPNNSRSYNVTGVLGNSGVVAETERPSFNVDMEPRGDGHPQGQSFILTGPVHKPGTGNIIIEEGDPETFGNASNNASSKAHSVTSKERNSKTREKSNGVGYSPRSHRERTRPDKAGNVTNNSNVLTQYCDGIDAEETHLCLSERVTHSHRHHVNISINHLSLKPLGDVYIYSAFLDTRRKPPSIRVMAAGPKGRNDVKRSGYWCAFSLPAVLAKQFYWNGRREPLTAKSDQATQLDYYAASVGHNRSLQFYIMSCPVPDKHFTSMVRFDTSRIHLVSGGKDSPLLETVQERIALDVVNNRGLPWQLLFNQSLRYNDNNVSRDKSNVNTQDIHSNGSSKDVSINMTSVNGNMTSSKSFGPRDGDSQYSYSSNPNSIVSCVAPISGTVGVVPIVEFLELTLLMGSQHIVMYTQRVSADVRDVLAMYQHHGLVTVLPWTILNPTSIWANGRDIALNDCLYRTMYRYEFALFHDMDEYFVSRVTPDLPSFINFLQSKGGLKNDKISDLLFSSAYFPSPTKLQSKKLVTLAGFTKDVPKFASLRSVHRTYFNQQHVLRMIRPVMAYRVGAGERKKTVYNISPRYAGVNHYTQCPGTTNGSSAAKHDGAAHPEANSGNATTVRKDSKPVIVCTDTKVDMYLWRFKDRLIRHSKDSIRELNAKRRLSP